MASSFIHINEIGFWAKDGFVEAMQLCLINEIENSGLENENRWLTDYKIELALQSLPMIFGGMSMALEEFLINNERKKIILNFINEITIKINKESNYLTGNQMYSFRKRAMEILRQTKKVDYKNEKEFNKYVNDSRWKESSIHEVKEYYSHSFKLLKLLINDEIRTTASSTMDYWNCLLYTSPSPRDATLSRMPSSA